MKERLLAPLKNRRAGEIEGESFSYMVKLAYIMLGICFLVFVMYTLQDTSYRSNIGKVLDTAVDSVESSCVINKGVQDYIRERLPGTIDYSNGYTITYSTYSVSNFGTVTVLGKSVNGAYIGDLTVPRGNIVRIAYSADSTDLDNMFSGIFHLDKEGLVEVKEGKVN